MNSIAVRCAVAIVFLVFAWKGSALDMSWSPRRGRDVIQPPNELLEWGKPLSTVLPRMTPADRIYLAAFYDAMAHILINDGARVDPILSDTEKFAAFHAGSLRLAVDKKDVGKYSGLGEAIDLVFSTAAGPEVQPVNDSMRARLISACGVLSWSFNIGRDQ